LDTNLSILKPLSLAWACEAWREMGSMRASIAAAVVKSGNAAAWDKEFQVRALNDADRLFGLGSTAAERNGNDVAPPLNERERQLYVDNPERGRHN
jgi:hypothetical protein